MEALLEQECVTEKQLETYKSQLELVEKQLSAGAVDPDKSDLEQLRENLTELISLTEDALLGVKKQRLLLSIQAVEAGASGIVESLSREEKKEKSQSEPDEDSDNLQGVMCQAPITEAWGAVNYHNAVILSREDGSSGGSEEEEEDEDNTVEQKVRVLFTQPTYNAIKPCPFFLDGKCKFDASACKFSHGHVVPLSQLLTYQEPDYSLASTGGKCLAKYSDGLWYSAIISSFDEEFTVHFPSLNATIEIPIENVYPQEGSDSDDDSSDSSDGEEEEEEAGDDNMMAEWVPSGAGRVLGDWEKYTTGIGSKLLAKMGYIVGKGLGKSGEGRVEPVEIKVLPPGKSLDMCSEMREKGKLGKAPGAEGEKRKRRRRRKRRKLLETAGVQEEKRVNVFDFLNDKLQHKDSKEESQSQSKPSQKSGNLNVQLFKVQEDIKAVKKRRQSLQTQLARHKGKDKMMETHVSEKLTANQRELEKLQTEERRIERGLKMKSERKKLRIF